MIGSIKNMIASVEKQKNMEQATSKTRAKKEAARSQPFPMKKKVQPEYMQPRIFSTQNPHGGRRIYASRRPPKASTKTNTEDKSFS
jgi:hypothetical protein